MFKGFFALQLLMFFGLHRVFAQTHAEQQQMLKDAEAVKKNSPAKKDPHGGLPPGEDNSWKVTVSLSRAILSESDLTSTGGGHCPSHSTSSDNYTLQANFSTDQAIGSLNGDDFDFQTDVDDQIRRFTNPLKGSYTFNAMSKRTSSTCDASGNASYGGNINIDPSTTGVSFHFNKKTKEGTFQIPLPENFIANGNGRADSWSKAQGHSSSDMSKFAKTAISSEFTFCALFRASNHPSKNAQIQQTLSTIPINGGSASIIETRYGYEITYSQSKTTNDIPEGWTGTSSVTYTTNVHISITDKDPIEYDAIIDQVNLAGNKISDKYDNWIPEGPAIDNKNPANAKGNSIGFTVHLVNKKKPTETVTGIDYDVEYKLMDVSREPGICINYPLDGAPGSEPDLKFDHEQMRKNDISYTPEKVNTTGYTGENFFAMVTSYDYGSYAKMEITVTPKYGPKIAAHFKDSAQTVISIPKDDDDNHIADYWEDTTGIFHNHYPAIWDNEKQAGNTHNGDGITLYEEYRGIVAKGKLKRLDPKKKELFIINKIGPMIKPGLGLLEKAADINVVELDSSGTKEDKIVNFNYHSFHPGSQTAILCVKHEFTINDKIDKIYGAVDATVMGLLEAKEMDNGQNPIVNSPKDAIEYRVNEKRLYQANNLLKNVPHELAHGCGVKHHGGDISLKWKVAKHFPVGTDEIVIENGNGQVISDPVFQPVDNDDIAEPNGAASGNVRCFMTYNQDYEYILKRVKLGDEKQGNNRTKYVFMITPFGVNEKEKKTSDFPQTIFCTNKTGTEWNADKKLSGDAEIGNCISQFQIKDW